MANQTAGIITITVQFESGTAAGFSKFSEGAREEAAILLDRLNGLDVRGVDVVDSDVLIGQTFVLSENGTAPTKSLDLDVDVDADVEAEVAAPAPRKRGRPPGTKNKPKAETADSDAPPKRRGRPPGSKNKPKVEEVVAEEEGEVVAPAPRKRGRPPGSKNKPKAEAAEGPRPAPKPKASGKIQRRA